MTIRVQRTRFFIAVEGDGEQSFTKWLQDLSDQNSLHIYLDCQPLGGGGYKTMVERTVRYRQRKERNKAPTFLLLDSDRAARDDGWTIAQLREQAAKAKINLCLQAPNQEGLLLRMLPGNERLQQDAVGVRRMLRSAWPEYQKPVDARTLASKFTLDDLLRVAQVDQELRNFLLAIGLMH